MRDRHRPGGKGAVEVDILSYGFMQRAVLAVVAAGLLCSVMSFFVVLGRLSFMGAGVSHAILAGLALGVVAGISPVLTGTLTALAIALVAGHLVRSHRLEADTVIGVLFSTGMALGIAIISAGDGYHPELFGLLFGNVLAVSAGDLRFLALVAAAVLGFTGLFFKELLTLLFDEELAAANGLPTTALYLSLLASLALTVVAAALVLGVVLASALLVIPAAAASAVTSNYRAMLLCSIAVGLVSGIAGLSISLAGSVPPGPAVVLTAALVFVGTLTVGRWARGRGEAGGTGGTPSPGA